MLNHQLFIYYLHPLQGSTKRKGLGAHLGPEEAAAVVPELCGAAGGRGGAHRGRPDVRQAPGRAQVPPLRPVPHPQVHGRLRGTTPLLHTVLDTAPATTQPSKLCVLSCLHLRVFRNFLVTLLV